MPGGVNDVDLLLNDLSLHGQFSDVSAFKLALERVIAMRDIARKFSWEIHANRAIVNGRISATYSLFEALQALPVNEKRALLVWFTKQGPFWEDAAEHSSDHWMQCGDEIVTDTAVGEAAYCATVGIGRGLVSFQPSDWTYSPVVVQIGPALAEEVAVPNYWQPTDLENMLRATPGPAASWNDLAARSRVRFQNLVFTNECFDYLDGQPFVPGVANRIISRLDVLDKLAGSVDEFGRRTPEGERLYQDHFTGDKGWFSDSSDTEKNEFRSQMLFPHPEQAGSYLFCTWHGKINHPPFRIHFDWPIRPGNPLYVAYVGLKITRR